MTKIPLMNNPLGDRVRAQNAYRVIEKICDHWKMSDDEKALMLGVEEDAYHAIMKSRTLPATEEILLRVSDMIALFRILSTIYYFDHHTIGRMWMKRKNWRAPFYGERPLDHMSTGYLALEQTRRHCEALIKSYGGVATGKESVIIGGVAMGEILAFNNFMLIQNEDTDILAMMLLRVCDSWKLSPEELVCFVQCDMSGLREVVEFRYFPEEKILTHWRTVLMIHYGLFVLYRGNENTASRWMRTSNIMLKNGMTPFCAIENGSLSSVHGLLKSLVKFMP